MIRTRNLTKVYGKLMALENLNLVVNEGEIFGYIGPNGAGKTTTLKILATLLAPTSGSAEVCGLAVGRDSRKIRPLIGYMPDFFGVYEDMTVEEYLTFFAAAYRITGDKRRRIVGEVLELTDLAGKRDSMVEALSRGMQQRLGLARTLVHDPRVLILDEPASGLDPRARIEIRALLKEVKNMGKTIIISSHILTELSELCDTIGILEKGQLLFSGTQKELARKVGTGSIIEVGVADRLEAARDCLRASPHVQSVEVHNDHLHVALAPESPNHSFIPQLLVENGYQVTLLQEEAVKLEDIFLRATKGVVA
ncbi:MAG: ABC transporter ATP-binding protein [Planctomycetota bacterium]